MLIDIFKQYFSDSLVSIVGNNKKILILHKDEIFYTLDKQYDEVWFIDCLNYISLKDFICIKNNIIKYKVLQILENTSHNPTVLKSDDLDNIFGIPGVKKWENSLNYWVYFNSSI